jgi:GGDEF domain-containing protein
MQRLDGLFDDGDALPRLLLLFDIDGFKAYNDTFGHSAGDGLLHRLGDRLSRSIAGRGTAYRLGGDEFCILVEGGSIDLEWVRAAAVASLRETGGRLPSRARAAAWSPPGKRLAALQLADRRFVPGRVPGSAISVGLFCSARTRRRARPHGGVADGLRARGGGRSPRADAKAVRAAAELRDIGKLATGATRKAGTARPGWELVRTR